MGSLLARDCRVPKKRFQLIAVVVALSVGLLVRDPSARAQDGSSEPTYRLDIGLGLRFMPIGWFDLADGARRTGFRAYPAFGGAPFVDYRLGRYVSVGVSPELTLNVIPNRSDYYVGTMLAGDARIQLRYPTQTRFEPYAMATCGYSVIWRADASSAKGPVVGGAVGSRLQLSSRHSVFLEAAYQKGFQRVDGGDYGPSYVIVSAGWQVGT